MIFPLTFGPIQARNVHCVEPAAWNIACQRFFAKNIASLALTRVPAEVTPEGSRSLGGALSTTLPPPARPGVSVARLLATEGAMEGTSADGWEAELGRWLEPFLARLGRKEQRHWAPFYLKGLILPGERKSVEPMAARVAPGDLQQLHHFVSTSPWATAPLEDELVRAADRLVGGPDAVLVVDDTALVKQGRRSVA